MSAMALADVRSAARELVNREEYRLRSRMLAYEAVGQMVGASGEWVRKFVKNYEGVALDFLIGRNILEYYQRICSRVERHNEHLRWTLHAATQGHPHQHSATAETVVGEEE